MIERLQQLWAALTWWQIPFAIVGFVATFVISYVVVTFILIKMPENYFRSDYEHHFLSDRHPVFRTTAIVVKNIIGVLVILTGIVLSLPGEPGTGSLTIFIGIMMTDVPGKRNLEAKIVHRPAVLSAINRLRARYHKPALILD